MIRDIAKYFKGGLVVNNSLHKSSRDDLLIYVESHIIRANIARVLGLIELLNLNDNAEQDEIIAKLESEIKDLEFLLEDLKEALPHILKDEF